GGAGRAKTPCHPARRSRPRGRRTRRSRRGTASRAAPAVPADRRSTAPIRAARGTPPLTTRDLRPPCRRSRRRAARRESGEPRASLRTDLLDPPQLLELRLEVDRVARAEVEVLRTGR